MRFKPFATTLTNSGIDTHLFNQYPMYEFINTKQEIVVKYRVINDDYLNLEPYTFLSDNIG